MNQSAIKAALLLLVLSGCATVKDYELGAGRYTFHQHGHPKAKVYVHMEEDSVMVAPIDTLKHHKLPIVPLEDEMFLKKSLDIDVITSLFKFRPSTQGFPQQLNTSFNGNLYVGYRIDRFKVRYKKTPFGITKEFRHNGISGGAFAGLGSTFVSPWTTNNQTTDEYDGFILSRGFTVLGAVNSLTVGVSIGWDYLTDRDKSIWIYQNKPWLGLTLGLNLN